ncbi:MAG TPA: ABC transporter permease [Myxococcota bacterium]|nr:ABC transporter permease [Myxococcota bacterium]
MKPLPSSSIQAMVYSLRELFARRDLLYILTWREIKVRYKQSVMGMLWAVLMPLIIVCSGLIVRYAFSQVSGKPLELSDLASVAVKSAPWAFFVAALRFGTSSLVSNSNLVTKVYMPRLAFPISAALAQLLDFVIASVVIGVILVLAHTGLSVHVLWVPVLIACLILMATAFAVIFSAGSLFLRDVKYLVDVFLTFAIFFTPVFYDSSLFGHWAPLVLVNPVSPLLEALSATVIHHQAPSLPWLAYSFGFTGLLCFVSLLLFARLEPLFAESV